MTTPNNFAINKVWASPASGSAGQLTIRSLVAGGGSNRVPVNSDGTNWRIG